jgi:hypothetical protein
MEIVEKEGTSCRRLSQTKILDGRTNISMSFFEALFKGVSPPRNVEKCFEQNHRAFRSAFQNLRLGAINFQRQGDFCSPPVVCMTRTHPSTDVQLTLGYYPRNLSIPNEDFGRTEQKNGRAISKYFSRVWVLYLGDDALKIASKMHARSLVLSSKIFVWGA